MLLIKTHLANSPIHGIGLFSDASIPAGTIVYTESPKFDIEVTIAEYEKLNIHTQKQIAHYGFFNSQKNMWHLAFDDIRFCNHSDEGNITVDESTTEYRLVANRDISAGEELLQNYREFEELRKNL